MKYFLLFCIMLSSSGRASLKITIKDLEEFINVQNPELKIKELELKSATSATGQISRSFLPKIQADVGMEKFNSGNYTNLTQSVGKVHANINLYNGGRDSLLEKYNIQHVELKRIDQLALKRDLLLEAKNLFYFIIALDQQAQIIQEAQVTNSNNLKFAINRIKNGFSSTTDKIDFEQNEISLNDDLVTLQSDRTNAILDLQFLLGIKDEIVVVGDLEESSKDYENFNLNFENLFEYKKMNLLTNLKELEIKKNKSSWIPSLDFYSEYIQYNQRDRDFTATSDRTDVVFGLKLTFNLFDGGISSKNSQIAEIDSNIQSEKAKLERKRSEINFEKNNNILTLGEKLKTNSKMNVDKTKAYYINTFNEYKRGVKNSPDVLQAAQRYYLAKIKLVNVLRENIVQTEKLKTYL